jgi:hypothetical protein
MKEQDLLKECRYYQGGNRNPYYDELDKYEIDKSGLKPPESMKTEYNLPFERVKELSEKGNFCMRENQWVKMMLEHDAKKYFTEIVDEYKQRTNGFSLNDETPITLKALLLNRYEHWGGTVESFKAFYHEYIKQPKYGKE